MNQENGYFTLITGASEGIGRAMAEECAMRKRNLLLVALPETGLPEFARELSMRYDIAVEILERDLIEPDSISDIMGLIKAKEIRVDALVNNVGVGYNGKFIALEQVRIVRMIMLNMQCTTILTQSLLPDLMHIPRSYIMNVCSMAAWIPLPGKSIYSATKAYVLFFSKSLRRELKKTGVTVTSVCPLGVPTNSTVKERIRNSGFLARNAVLKAPELARIAIGGMLKGKSTIIPGRMGKFILLVGLMLPHGIVLKFLEKEIMRAPN